MDIRTLIHICHDGQVIYMVYTLNGTGHIPRKHMDVSARRVWWNQQLFAPAPIKEELEIRAYNFARFPNTVHNIRQPPAGGCRVLSRAVTFA